MSKVFAKNDYFFISSLLMETLLPLLTLWFDPTISLSIEGKVKFLKCFEKEGSDFSHKKKAVGKIGAAVLKKGVPYHLFSY